MVLHEPLRRERRTTHVDREDIHSLAAAYALDALAFEEERVFVEHLLWCEACRDEVATLQEPAAALAYALPAPPAPTALRRRVLAAARAERRVASPWRSRFFVLPALTAAAATCAAVALGIVALTALHDREAERAARADRDLAALVLVQPDARRLALRGAEGALVRGSAGDSALVVSGLEPAGDGNVYQAWVVDGGRSLSAGTFEAGSPATVHALTLPVSPDAFVTVTVEPRGGSSVPTGSPVFRSVAI